MNQPQLKLGKQPFTESPHDFLLRKLTAVELPSMPKRRFGHGSLYDDWGMLGNSRAGDCVFAGADHETMMYLKMMHHIVSFNDRVALEDYAAVTGYDPVTGNNDNGTYVREAMSYRRKTGVIDALGQRHKIDAYIQINAKDWEMMMRAVWTFGAVGIGFEFPQSGWAEFDAGKPWSVHPGSQIEGGHYVPVVGSTSPSKRCTVVTWARRQEMTREFYEEYNDEAWIPYSLESLSKTGYNFRHIDNTQLEEMLHSL